MVHFSPSDTMKKVCWELGGRNGHIAYKLFLLLSLPVSRSFQLLQYLTGEL